MNRTFHHFKKTNTFSAATPIRSSQGTYINQLTEAPTPTETQLICPSCYNKNNPSPIQELKSKKTVLPKGKEGVALVDNHKIENEQFIQGRIANRDRLARGAFRSILNFKNASKETLQHHHEHDPNFFQSTDHNMVRARNKSKKLEEVLNNYPEQFNHKDKPDVAAYYNKCIGVGINSYLLKSSSCSMFDKEDYKNALKRQMELQILKNQNAQYKQKAEDNDLLRKSMNEKDIIFKAKNDHKTMMKRQCHEQNSRMIDDKKLNNENEKECVLKQEKEIINNTLRKMEEYKRELRNKKNHLNKVCNENKIAQMRGQELKVKEKNDDKKYTNNGYIKALLCQHGCNMGTCSMCFREFPKRVLTPIVVRKRKS